MKKITLLAAFVAIVFTLSDRLRSWQRTPPVSNPRVPKPSRRSTSSIAWPPARRNNLERRPCLYTGHGRTSRGPQRGHLHSL